MVPVFAPMAASFYGAGAGSDFGTLTLVLGAAIWLAASVALHLGARRIFGKLTP